MKLFRKILFIFFIFVVIFIFSVFAKQKNNKNTQNAIENNNNLLKQINTWQEKYWNITNKNIDNVTCLAECDKDSLNKNIIELKKIEKDVNKTIKQNNKYLKKLNEPIVKEKKSETQFEMNMEAGEKLEKTDTILNEIYSEIKSSISQEDFNNLKSTQRLWLKELNNYTKEFEKRVGGSIAPMLINSQINEIKYFRTLLLISYFENYKINN